MAIEPPFLLDLKTQKMLSIPPFTHGQIRLETFRLETIRKAVRRARIFTIRHSVLNPSGGTSNRAQITLSSCPVSFSSVTTRNEINPYTFTSSDLTNLLSEALVAVYSFSAVQIFRSAVCLLRKDPDQIRLSTDLKALLNPIPYASSTPLAELKTAFLLAVATFLRPSDLECISLHNCIVTSHGDLAIKVVAPKELRAGRRIVKTLTIRRNDNFKKVCPVRSFKALKSHPLAPKRQSNKLLVNAKDPTRPLKTTTIST